MDWFSFIFHFNNASVDADVDAGVNASAIFSPHLVNCYMASAQLLLL